MSGVVEKAIVIHQGSKFFWRTRNSIDVSIIDHKNFNVTEVVSYEPSIDLEAKRIYLNSIILGTKLDQELMEEKLRFAKQNNVPHTERFLKDIEQQAATDYILNRLFLTEFAIAPKSFAVQLQFNFRDRDLEVGDDSIEKLLCDCPAGLSPYKIIHHKIYSAEEKEAAVKALETERQTLEEHCNAAIALQTQTSMSLGIKERWRIPIVLAKLARGRGLSEADGKIWASVASNLHTQEDIDRVTKVTMRAIDPIAKRDVSIHAAAKSSSPVGGRLPPTARTPSHTPLHTPHRSPCITPRSVSSRLLVGTASSQSRANSFAEDMPQKLPHKLSKIGKKKSVRRSRSRLLGTHSSSADTENDDSEPSMSSMHTAETVSFVSQLTAGLASLTSFKRSKGRDCESDEPGMANQFSSRGSMKADGATVGEKSDSPEVGEQRRTIGAFNPHLLGTTSTMPSFRGEFAFLNAVEATPPLYSQHSVVLPCSGGAGIAEIGDESVAPPRKRRSYFGAMLASFTRADSSASLGSAGSGPSKPVAVLKKKTSKRGGQMLFGDALAGWLWGNSAQVVPVDLPEYHPSEYPPDEEPVEEYVSTLFVSSPVSAQ